MSVRIHVTTAASVHVALVTNFQNFNGLFDDDDDEITVPALVIEDPGNLEALVILGDLDELQQLGYDIAVTLGNDTAAPQEDQ